MAEESSTPNPERRKLLIVDDDPVLREVLSIGLQAAGYEAIAVENGAKAIPVITDEKPAAVLLDLLMPVMDGLQLLRWLKEKGRADVPVLVLTCLDSRAVAVDALVAGAADVLLKPFRFEVLLGRLAALT